MRHDTDSRSVVTISEVENPKRKRLMSDAKKDETDVFPFLIIFSRASCASSYCQKENARENKTK